MASVAPQAVLVGRCVETARGGRGSARFCARRAQPAFERG